MRRISTTSFLAAAACLVVVVPAVGQPSAFKDLVGKKAREIRARKKHVFNTDKPPKLKRLRGQVVWLEFSFIH